ncbi:HAD family hydrolase [Methylomonas rapida]|uniref:sucrose-phosphate synthase n=1 Tax=Methylomonas rapida TaxID=2963939 RepID=A0ABY7GK69_9GAMM|nr:HAD family hydrolase [Methylomonas rapida]WAR44113.1 glycosyltransferase [Methylomonas rapida]
MTSNITPEPLYIVMISIHGLIRGHDLELGRDADTGGQTKYVVELAKALAKQPNVERVDLVTRRIIDSDISHDYAEPVEPLAENAQIIRVDAGPEGYIRKEELWDHLDSFADNLLSWLHRQSRWPDVLHSHYADAGYVGVRLSHWTGLPLIHTGHSLGRDKCRRLLALGLTMDEIEQRYHISRRIDAEEDTLSNADLVITSTRNEIEDQYELYDCYSPEKMAILPPGTDLEQFHPPAAMSDENAFAKSLRQFLNDPNKPMILALSRPDERKNIVSLLEAYGQSPALQSKANLVIVAGNRDDIREMNEGAQGVLTELLLVMDCYDLYGRVALPKHHSADDVAEIYRLAAASKGVFINPALTEPFGLTLLEAAASGLPLVATENGGPTDIIGNCQNGILVDPLDKTAIAEALLGILENPQRWQMLSANGLENVARYYSWQAHAQAYLQRVQPLLQHLERLPKTPPVPVTKTSRLRTQAIFTALDNTLLGDDEGLAQFVKLIRDKRKKCLFGIATGRRLDSVLAILKQHRIPAPDILITSLGTEIYFTPQLIADIAWSYHIDHLWTPQVLRRILSNLPGLTPQPKSEQSRFKISYYYDSQLAPPMEEILALLRQHELSVNPTLSFGQFLDIVPARASKGQALRYVARQWDIPLERILATGGSGGDSDMVSGNTRGVVVANRHREELSLLAEMDQVYFAESSHAWGILEAIEHYDFFSR